MVMQRLTPWLGHLRRLHKDRRGAVAMIVGLAVLPLFAMIGLAVDVGRGYMLRSKLSYAIDAAGLAGGRAFDQDNRADDIMMFFEANFPSGYMQSTLEGGAPSVTFDDVQNTITIQATATIPTRFMSVLGIDDMTVSATTLIQREMRGMELILVMDNTGSMRSGGKMTAMKDAATDLVDILYGDNEEIPNFWVGLVPYAATVNIGSDHTDWLDGYDAADFLPTTWKGCVEARDFPNDSNDALPTAEAWVPFRWPTTLGMYWSDGYYGAVNPDFEDDDGDGEDDSGSPFVLGGDNEWDPDGAESDLLDDNSDQNEGTGPNLGCGPAITPLVPDKTTVQAAIDEMQPWHRGGTMANLGLAWGWRVLSPQWRGMWPESPAELPLDYNAPNMEKVVVLLTDGENQWYDWPGTNSYPSGVPGSNKNPDDDELNHDSDDYKSMFPGADYTAYGRLNEGRLGTTSKSVANDILDDRMADMCQDMKDQDVVMYTITFGSGTDSETQDLFRGCASDPDKYFHAPSNSDLQQAFVQIADELSNLRIAE